MEVEKSLSTSEPTPLNSMGGSLSRLSSLTGVHMYPTLLTVFLHWCVGTIELRLDPTTKRIRVQYLDSIICPVTFSLNVRLCLSLSIQLAASHTYEGDPTQRGYFSQLPSYWEF
ncbi:hypothetical protein TNCV_3063731 [Trichonephila clavipes]|nr:hypothetical protein TNCV_3063731 [Trichonephila clavipes]